MTKTEQKAESAANKLIAFGRRSEHKAKDAATEIRHEKRVIAERAREFAQSGPGMAVIGTAAAYVTLRGGIALFHRMRRNFLRQLMEDVSTALDRLGATYWLDFGALLGVYRDGDLILHDNDVDFAVMDPDWPKLMEGLKATLPPHKYTLKIVVPGNKPESSWIRVYCPFGMSDLFGAYSDKPGSNGAEMSSSGQSNKVYVDNGHDDTMHIDRGLVLPTSRKPWKGINMSMPHDVEGTLRRRYGDEWNVPKYAAKGADTVEGNKPYMKVFRALAKLGIRI